MNYRPLQTDGHRFGRTGETAQVGLHRLRANPVISSASGSAHFSNKQKQAIHAFTSPDQFCVTTLVSFPMHGRTLLLPIAEQLTTMIAVNSSNTDKVVGNVSVEVNLTFIDTSYITPRVLTTAISIARIADRKAAQKAQSWTFEIWLHRLDSGDHALHTPVSRGIPHYIDSHVVEHSIKVCLKTRDSDAI